MESRFANAVIAYKENEIAISGKFPWLVEGVVQQRTGVQLLNQKPQAWERPWQKGNQLAFVLET